MLQSKDSVRDPVKGRPPPDTPSPQKLSSSCSPCLFQVGAPSSCCHTPADQDFLHVAAAAQ
ncbi:hypothetical protein EYF80_021877 [Liparis tanakae]|uniref:Uncharacterized protein n=1 Tax=Liparis tanakae TaxID=230148 RepID=A0A4Z2HQ18_9TELE|nr:hypothetical protein EYF80_021877 [Liparis tanakae]